MAFMQNGELMNRDTKCTILDNQVPVLTFGSRPSCRPGSRVQSFLLARYGHVRTRIGHTLLRISRLPIDEPGSTRPTRVMNGRNQTPGKLSRHGPSYEQCSRHGW